MNYLAAKAEMAMRNSRYKVEWEHEEFVSIVARKIKEYKEHKRRLRIK